MKPEFNAYGRQEREEILNENLIAANRKIKELEEQCFELSIENVEQQKTIKHLRIAITVIIWGGVGLMFLINL